MTVLGIDYSRWQDDNSTPQMMNLEKARNSGAHFGFMKVSQSTWLDQDYVLNWAHTADAGLPKGGYCFLDWSTAAINQARFFAGALKYDSGELPPVIDFECRTNNPGKAKATEELYTACQTVEQELGRMSMIYTAPYFWREFFSGAHANYFADRPLWIAHYGVTRPTVPAPWDVWTFWQYSAKGDGIKFGAESKDLDMDYFNGDLAAFNRAFGLTRVPTVEERLDAIEARLTALEGK